jgi:hypothetical protein
MTENHLMSRYFAAAILAISTLGMSCKAPSSTGGPGAAVGDGENPISDADRSSLAGDAAFRDGVTVRLSETIAGAQTISFGVPVPPGALAEASTVRVTAQGAPLAANVRELLAEHGPDGQRTGVRSILVQLPASVLTGPTMDVRIHWKNGPGSPPGASFQPFSSAAVSADSAATATTATRTIQSQNGQYSLVEGPPTVVSLFSGKEPRVLAEFPEGYLARTGLLGQQSTRERVSRPDMAGMRFLSDALENFALSAMYEESYALNPAPDSVVDPIANYEGWLYDRCATFLTAYVHFNDTRFLRHAHRACSNYASRIELSGKNAGYFTGKSEPDAKYSHLRGLIAYYAITGNELAYDAGHAIADMWNNDTLFVKPYREGHVRGPDKLWTERLLATSMEGLFEGHRLTGDLKYLESMKQLVDTAYKHLTGDASALAAINPSGNFPPQNCFVHNAEQQAEGTGSEPWCSPWMSELMVDVLLRYQAQTGDVRVDEMFLRLGRFLRDVGTSYFTNDVVDDTFLAPTVCDNPNAGDNRRRLVPLYGAALDASMKRRNFGDYDDMMHCADASALSSAAIRALKRQGTYDANPMGPFASEGAAMLALHHELASCAQRTFAQQTRPGRDPATWTSAALAPGAGDPAAFISSNRIGYPVHNQAPQRRISWWFNMSMLDYGLLDEAGVAVPMLVTGAVQPASCP